ncbi:MAG: hypothetical protein K2O29_08415 [Ruminococcus sp.]|nr:hypothetical protein [Ruminococcus sp.]MDE7138462.1 hypothetical protein [Ruminococcus sp.]
MAKRLKPSESYDEVFNRILEQCIIKNTTVSDMIDMCGLSRSVITAWKRGNINPKALSMISKRLNVSMEYITDGKDFPSDIPKNNNIQLINARENELLRLFRTISEEEQLKLIGRLELLSELAQTEESAV